MKKVFQSAIVLSLVLLSCSDEADRTENITGTVGFHATDVAASRAGILDTDTLHKYGFRVSAYSTGATAWADAKDTATPGFMHDQLVTWNTSTNAWTYGPPAKYWPGKVDGTDYGMVSFFAWNDVGAAVDVSPSTAFGAPTLTYTVPDAHAGQKDLVVAMATDKTAEGGAVPLAFDHVLSRIGFRAKLKESYANPVTITSLKVKYTAGKVQSKGIYTFGDNDHAAGVWTEPEDGEKAYMSHTDAGDELVATGGVALTESSQTVNGADSYLMLLPQTVGAGGVTIEVKWTDGGVTPHTHSLDLPHQVWLPGKRYDYNLTVTLTGITLDPVAVNPWGEASLYQPCTITYNANGGTGNDIVEHRMTNVSYPVDDHIFERSFYSHQGWNTERDGGGTAYRAGDHIFCTRDLTLYAQWDLIDDITYDNNVFTIEADGEYVITGNTNGNSVKVAPDVTATVTLKDASIVMNDGCAFDVEAGATVTLVLEGTNTLKSGGDNAGLHVPVDAAIIITSASGDGSTDGVLHVTGGDASAGIGGNASRYVYVDRVNNIRTPGDAGTIIIKGGTITATGGNGREDGHGGGAGIGGGGANPGYDTGCKGGDGGIVTITGGHVTARGGDGYPLPGHIESENSRFNGAGAGIGGGGGADLVGSGGEATYSGPGEPIQATVSWEGWNDSRTAFVSATAGTSQGGAQAIGYGGHGSY